MRSLYLKLVEARMNPRCSGGNAVISLIFAEYINRLFYMRSEEEVSPDEIPQWAIKLTAIAAVLVVTILCVAARKLGTRVAVVFTTLKIVALVSLLFLTVLANELTSVVDAHHDFGNRPTCEGKGIEFPERQPVQRIKS